MRSDHSLVIHQCDYTKMAHRSAHINQYGRGLNEKTMWVLYKKQAQDLEDQSFTLLPQSGPRMSCLSDADPMDQDSLIADEANKQLHRELRQSGQSEGVASQLAQQTIPIAISLAYVKDWDTANAFRELYQNWYVTISPVGYLLRRSRKDAILQRFQLD